MKRLKMPTIFRPSQPAKHRAGGRKLSSKPGRHRPAEPPIPPHSEAGDYSGRHRGGPGYTASGGSKYKGRHRDSDPPPKGHRREGDRRYRTGGPRQTPSDDREHGYFRRR